MCNSKDYGLFRLIIWLFIYNMARSRRFLVDTSRHEKATAALTTLVTGKPDVTQASELHTSAKVNLVFTISLPHRNLENPVVCTGSRLNAEFASRSVLHRCFTGLRLHVTASQGTYSVSERGPCGLHEYRVCVFLQLFIFLHKVAVIVNKW